jgi:hypothetical protein
VPFSSVKLIPGVQTEQTPTLAQANYVASQLIRFRDGLCQKLGGWIKFYPLPVAGVPKHLHAWQDLNETGHLAVGTTTQLVVLTSGTPSDITPQILISDFTPDFDTTSGSAVVTINDPNISTVTTFDAVFFNTPIAVGGLILSGMYPITLVTGTTTYQINAGALATATVANGGVVPSFSVTSGTPTVTVTLAAHGLSVGEKTAFEIATTVGGITIQGSYDVLTVGSSSTFTISANTVATSTTSAAMNGGEAQLAYYIALGPQASGVGYGLGTYGTGTYGLGVVPTAQTGTPVTSTNWQLDNYGDLLIACRRDGGIYQWSPTGGFNTGQLISGAPTFNTGAFVSGQAPILIAYGCSQDLAIGEDQDGLLWRNSSFEDFNDWTESLTNQARRARIPTGSRIVGGIAGPKYDHLWTDLDFWTLNYAGFPLVYDTQPTATACGLIAQHAVRRFRDAIYWMGKTNFFVYAGGGVQIIPCSVWDAVFQNINEDQYDKVWCWTSTPFNEVWWFYPSAGQTECDKYAKFNTAEPSWDIGDLPRTAGIDQSVLGNPIASTSSGLIYQHEEGYDADGAPMMPSFTTGYAEIAEGEDYLFVDQWLPDMRWGTYPGNTGAQLSVTFHLVNYPGDTPVDYGPYPFSKSTNYIATRMRGRQVAMTVSSADSGSFWRLGKVRFRFGADGRR